VDDNLGKLQQNPDAVVPAVTEPLPNKDPAGLALNGDGTPHAKYTISSTGTSGTCT
jgi:hypothetical protein